MSGHGVATVMQLLPSSYSLASSLRTYNESWCTRELITLLGRFYFWRSLLHCLRSSTLTRDDTAFAADYDQTISVLIVTDYLHISIQTWVISSLLMWTVTTAFSHVTTLSDIRLDIWLSTLHQSALLLKKSDNTKRVSAQPISLCILHLSSFNRTKGLWLTQLLSNTDGRMSKLAMRCCW